MHTQPLTPRDIPPANNTIERLAAALITELLARRNGDARRDPATEQSLLPFTEREVFVSGDLRLDPLLRTVSRAGRDIRLTFMEFELLLGLARMRGMPLRKDSIRAAIWDNAIPRDSRSIDQHVSELRRKLGDSSSQSIYIRTVRRFGYALKGQWVPAVSDSLSDLSGSSP